MKRPEMGQWCEVKAKAIKRHRPVNELQFKRYPFITRFERKEVPTAPAMFIGWRTVWEGKTHWEPDYDEGGRDYGTAEFKKERSLEVWLFVSGPRTAPFQAFPADVEWESNRE